MKNKIILIMILLLLTGCKVEYKINLNDNWNIDESLTITSSTEDGIERINNFDINIPIDGEVNEYFALETKIDGLDYYDIIKENGNLVIKHNYDNKEYEKYIDSRFAKMAFEYISVNKVDDNMLVLSSSKEFLLFKENEELEEVRVTITTDYKVLSHSADEKNNRDYTWIFNKDNAYGKGIYLKVDMSKEDLTFFEKFIRGDYLNILTFSIIILIIGYILYKIIKKRDEKINEI